MIKLIGLDPSLRNFGVSLANYDEQTKSLDIYNGFVIHSEPDKTLSQAKQDVRTARLIYQEVLPLIKQADYWSAEVPIGSQSSRAMASYGVCVGIIGSLVAINPNFQHFTPFDVKKAVGNKSVSKDDVIDWVKQNYPNVVSWLPKQKNQAEHICDSIITLHLLREYLNENYPFSK